MIFTIPPKPQTANVNCQALVRVLEHKSIRYGVMGAA